MKVKIKILYFLHITYFLLGFSKIRGNCSVKKLISKAASSIDDWQKKLSHNVQSVEEIFCTNDVMLVVIIVCLALRSWHRSYKRRKDGLCRTGLKLDMLLESFCGWSFLWIQTVLELALSFSFQLSFI